MSALLRSLEGIPYPDSAHDERGTGEISREAVLKGKVHKTEHAARRCSMDDDDNGLSRRGLKIYRRRNAIWNWKKSK